VAGFGITAIAASFVLPQLERGELKLLLPDFQLGSPVEMYLQYPDRAYLPLRVRVVADYLQAQLRSSVVLRVSAEQLRSFAA
jgi:DNA-binding transcriptional LysR family regulator